MLQQHLTAPGKLIAIALATLTLVAACAPVFAQEMKNPPATDRNSLTIGVGVGYTPSYEGSDDYVVIPSGVIRGKVAGFSFFSRGPIVFVDLVREDGEVDVSLGPVVSARFDRTTQIKDRQVRALGKLDTAIEVGGFVGIAKTGIITSDYDNLGVRVSYVHDVTGTHGSYVITPAIEYGTPLSRKAYLGISASADYVGKGYASTYYGVTPAGSLASGLPAYVADDAGFKKFNINLLGSYSLTGDLTAGLSVFAVGSYGRMLGDFKRSPIVRQAGDADQWFGGLGVAYTF